MRESNAIFCGADSSRVQQQPWFIIIPSKKPIKKLAGSDLSAHAHATLYQLRSLKQFIKTIN